MNRFALLVLLTSALSGCGGQPDSDPVSFALQAATQAASVAAPFEYSPDGILATYWAIKSNYNDSYCIEGGYNDGDDVQLGSCPSGYFWLTRMQWNVVLVERAYYNIINRSSGLCLEFRGTGSTNYYKEIACDSIDEQLFALPNWGSSSTAIRPKSASTYYVWPEISADRVYNLTSSTTWTFYTQT